MVVKLEFKVARLMVNVERLEQLELKETVPVLRGLSIVSVISSASATRSFMNCSNGGLIVWVLLSRLLMLADCG